MLLQDARDLFDNEIGSYRCFEMEKRVCQVLNSRRYSEADRQSVLQSFFCDDEDFELEFDKPNGN